MDTLFLLHVSQSKKELFFVHGEMHRGIILILLLVHSLLYYSSIIPFITPLFFMHPLAGRSPCRQSPGLNRQKSLFRSVALKRGSWKHQNKDLHCDYKEKDEWDKKGNHKELEIPNKSMEEKGTIILTFILHLSMCTSIYLYK